jgi:hypothetical protein
MATKVSPNPWGDQRAAIAVSGQKRSTPMQQAASGPAENPPTPAAPLRQRHKMAGGK